jgi:hypothetical protein
MERCVDTSARSARDSPPPSEPVVTALRRAAVVAVLAVNLIGVAVFTAAGVGSTDIVRRLVFATVALAYPVVGGIVLWRRTHPIGWLLLVLSVLMTASHLGSYLLGGTEPLGISAAWRVTMVVAVMPYALFATLLLTLGFRFPDGRPLSARWRWAERLYALGFVSLACAMLLTREVRGGPPDGFEWTLANPLWTPATERLRTVFELTAGMTLWPSIILALIALVLRFRRSDGVQRQQLRWLLFPIGAVLISWPLVAGSVLLIAGWDAAGLVGDVFSSLLLAVPPLGMGVAITRYGLYDLQRLVSRTVSYAVVSLVLATIYAGAVLLLGTAARAITDGSGDLVVALSTLVVAAAFGPVRRRVQDVVDRRFNRRRIDTAAIIEHFGQRLRDDVDLAQLAGELHVTVVRAMAPRSVTLVLMRARQRP